MAENSIPSSSCICKGDPGGRAHHITPFPRPPTPPGTKTMLSPFGSRPHLQQPPETHSRISCHEQRKQLQRFPEFSSITPQHTHKLYIRRDKHWRRPSRQASAVRARQPHLSEDPNAFHAIGAGWWSRRGVVGASHRPASSRCLARLDGAVLGSAIRGGRCAMQAFWFVRPGRAVPMVVGCGCCGETAGGPGRGARHS